MRGKRRGLTRATRRSLAQQAATTKAQEAGRRAARREAAAKTMATLAAVRTTAEHAMLDRLVERAYRNGRTLPGSALEKSAVDGFLGTVLSRRPRLADWPYVRGLELLAHVPWSADPAAWRPDGSGSLAAIRSLSRHLLGPYPFPYFLVDSLLDPWFHPDLGVNQLQVAALIGRGDSLYRDGRGYFFLPLTMSRRMCHELLRTPTDLTLTEAILRAQVLGYGGSETLARAMLSLTWYFQHEEFTAEVIRWICGAEGVEASEFSSVYDYLWQIRRDDPTYSLRGRSWRAVVRAADRWRRDRDLLDRLECGEDHPRRKRPTQFAPSGFAGFREVRTWTRKGRLAEQTEWTISEIVTPHDLIDEGRLMMHCVARYANDIHTRRSSIWSLQQNGRRCLTIQVRNDSREVVQMCGKTNRKPRSAEYAVVLAWAGRNGLAVSPPMA